MCLSLLLSTVAEVSLGNHSSEENWRPHASFTGVYLPEHTLRDRNSDYRAAEEGQRLLKTHVASPLPRTDRRKLPITFIGGGKCMSML